LLCGFHCAFSCKNDFYKINIDMHYYYVTCLLSSTWMPSVCWARNLLIMPSFSACSALRVSRLPRPLFDADCENIGRISITVCGAVFTTV
jgi:hypothetical protein